MGELSTVSTGVHAQAQVTARQSCHGLPPPPAAAGFPWQSQPDHAGGAYTNNIGMDFVRVEPGAFQGVTQAANG